MNISTLIPVGFLSFDTTRLTHAIIHLSIHPLNYLLSTNYMPVSIIGPRVNYSPVNDLVEVLLIFYLIILTLMQYVEI